MIMILFVSQKPMLVKNFESCFLDFSQQLQKFSLMFLIKNVEPLKTRDRPVQIGECVHN